MIKFEHCSHDKPCDGRKCFETVNVIVDVIIFIKKPCIRVKQLLKGANNIDRYTNNNYVK